MRAPARRRRAAVVAVWSVLAVVAACSSDGEAASPDRGTAAGQPSSATRAGSGDPSTSTTTTTAAPTTTTTAPPRSFTLAVTGDLLIHSPVARRAAANAGGAGADFGPMLADVSPVLSGADLALCHLETPLAAPGQAQTFYPIFRVPPELAGAVAAAGWDGCSTSSNHALDGGETNVVSTLDELDAAGVEHTGTARSAEEAAELRLYEAAGVRVGHLSFSYGFNGFELPSDRPWLANRIEPGRILAEAAALRAAGAEVVVVSLHWGVEFVSDPTDEQDALARTLLASPDIDLLVGHHAHVVQPVERIGDEVVVYGLGNFLSNQSSACCPTPSQDGVIVLVTMTERLGGGPGFAASAVQAVPTLVERGSYRIVPTARRTDPATPPDLRAALEASEQRTAATLGARGAVVELVAP